jgi:hypothetical protein
MLVQPNMFANWLAYLVGAYLNKEYDVCIEIFDSMEKSIESKSYDYELKPFEFSEFLLFKIKVLEEKGEVKKAIKYMTKKTIDK